MPFLRFSRDKRGYEHTYLVHATNRRGKPVRPRVLYWFRTPPGVRLGRQPFDDEVCRMLEVQNPGIVFDWATIVKTPFPPAEPEHWRERRKAERVARQSRREEDGEDIASATASTTPTESAEEQAPSETVAAAPFDGASAGAAVGTTAATQPGSLRRRRRRGGRGRSRTGVPSGEAGTQLEAPVQQPSEPRVSESEDQE